MLLFLVVFVAIIWYTISGTATATPKGLTMRRNRLWLIVGIVSLLLIVLCVSGTAASYFFFRNQIATFVEQGNDLPFGEPSARPRGTPVPTPSALPSPPSAVAADLSASLVPGSRQAVADQPGAPRYRIDAEFAPDQRTITGTQTVVFTNTENVALDNLYFRLYVNAPHYNEGGVAVDDIRVNGAAAQTTLEVDQTALRITLPQPLEPNQSTDIALNFVTTIPSGDGGYGIFGERDGVWALYNWHPELAVYENGDWLLHPIGDQGDPTNTDAANYDVTLRAPATYTIISSGVAASRSETGAAATHSLVSALTRNFVLVASDQLTRTTRDVGDVRVSSYHFPEDAAGGAAALDAAVRSIEVFNERFGAYPYTELDVAEVTLGGGAAGMESTGLIMIATNLYDAPPQTDGNGAPSPDTLGFVVAHEAAHQWWYGVIGSDAYRQPWLDEGLTNWSATLYWDEVGGADAGQEAREQFTTGQYRFTLVGDDQRLDQPVDAFNGFAYSTIVYGKGAVLYDALRAELGDDTFFRFLQQYYEQHRFERVDGEDWLETLNKVAGRDMTPFYQRWIEGTNITADDLPGAP